MSTRPGTRHHARLERRHSTYRERLAAANTPAKRVASAQAYLRAVLANIPPEHAEQVAVEVVAVLEATAAQLERAHPRRRAAA